MEQWLSIPSGNDYSLFTLSGIRSSKTESRMVQLRLDGPQTSVDVAQAFANGRLRELQAAKRISTREITRMAVATAPRRVRVASNLVEVSRTVVNFGNEKSASEVV